MACDTSWIDQFRSLYQGKSRHLIQQWFWNHIDWSQNSIWIGKMIGSNNLPQDNDKLLQLVNKLIKDVKGLKKHIYLKIYYTRKQTTGDPEINYLILCNKPELPTKFTGSLLDVMFHKYRVTPELLEKDPEFKELVNHYLSWSNFYQYQSLEKELTN